MINIQSNSIRGETLQNVAGMVVQEIMSDILPMFGPGASDAFITKEGQPYYTRDGMEVMSSLVFDNELANYIHHIFFQAAYHHGKKVGDGSTTVIAVYTKMYQLIMEDIEKFKSDSTFSKYTINDIRAKWKRLTGAIIEELKKHTVPLTEERLLQMLYTCTQDADLAVKIFTELKEPIMAGAYILPRKSNIASDFKVTSHTRPLFKVTKQFSFKPVDETIENAAVLFCNGMLDIAHDEVFAGLATRRIVIGEESAKQYVDLSYVILCNGITEATRRSIKTFIQTAKDNKWDISSLNNIIIYSLNEARTMMPDEIEDIATILTEEKGLGGMVQPITFESYLYRAFVDCVSLGFNGIEELETFDADMHIVDQMKQCVMNHQWKILVDDVEGIALEGELGPVAEERHQELLKAIREEKTAVKKEDLNRRLRRTYGQFIDVEVGSTLLKDSQRKFELILDALLSASEAAKNGILEGNAMLHVLEILRNGDKTFGVNDGEGENWHFDYGWLLTRSFEWAVAQVIHNVIPTQSVTKLTDFVNRCIGDPNYDIADFNTLRSDNVWPEKNKTGDLNDIVVTVDGDDGTATTMAIKPNIVEPVGVISAVIENSILPIELAMTKVFHISGRSGFMDNYIDQPNHAINTGLGNANK